MYTDKCDREDRLGILMYLNHIPRTNRLQHHTTYNNLNRLRYSDYIPTQEYRISISGISIILRVNESR